MGLFERLPLDDLRPATLWAVLDADTRRSAAEALYTGEHSDSRTRREADMAVAAAIRFREIAVRKLSIDKRVDYLLRAVRPEDPLASSLVMSLHLEQRRGLLAAFLDALEVPHDDGMIQQDVDPDLPVERLASAAAGLYQNFDEAEVDLYLASLLALDPDTWSGLLPYIQERRNA
jgi:hypothetical protein